MVMFLSRAGRSREMKSGRRWQATDLFISVSRSPADLTWADSDCYGGCLFRNPARSGIGDNPAALSISLVNRTKKIEPRHLVAIVYTTGSDKIQHCGCLRGI